ncbi:MAG TPA: DEAD/DEAH box helicase, partial [Actinomycetota bacterium]|nr:DEAD/DEAH box helicase [Actinomycetota bacterium]
MSRLPFSAPTTAWFTSTFERPTAAQEGAWSAISSGEDALVVAPTGSGKTLAAFLWSIDELAREAAAGTLQDQTAVIYVSPLKALGNDVQKNLAEPLARITELARAEGHPLPEIRVAVRSGDTPTSERTSMMRTPPHILITTPESLYILLTSDGGRKMLKTARAVIVDEIHAVAGDKRGAHLALSLERLDRLAGRRLQRIGLSATVKPIEDVGSLLTGGRPCRIVDTGHRRDWDLSVWVPTQPLGPIASGELRTEVIEHIAELSRAHRTTLVFVNTRRLVERVSHQLSEILGPGKVAAHHGSLSRKIRLTAERGLKSGEIPVVVATASLELGIDVGHVDLVCHLGAPRAISTMLQRVGRSNHGVMGVPKGVLFPLTRDELVQCAAAVRAARAGDLDRVLFPDKPLDVLAQQIVAECAAVDMTEDEAFEFAKRAHQYRDLARTEFDDVLDMLTEGVATSRGRRSAWLHHDRVNGVLKGKRGARLAAITSGGAIPDTADYDVVADPDETFVGKVNEDFAIESMAGDIFLLGNTSWRIRRVEAGKVRVVDAQGAPPTIPFWIAEAPSRTAELSTAVSSLREDVARGLGDPETTVAWLEHDC